MTIFIYIKASKWMANAEWFGVKYVFYANETYHNSKFIQKDRKKKNLNTASVVTYISAWKAIRLYWNINWRLEVFIWMNVFLICSFLFSRENSQKEKQAFNWWVHKVDGVCYLKFVTIRHSAFGWIIVIIIIWMETANPKMKTFVFNIWIQNYLVPIGKTSMNERPCNSCDDKETNKTAQVLHVISLNEPFHLEN